MTDVFYNRFGYRQRLLEELEQRSEVLSQRLVIAYNTEMLCKYIDTQKDIQIQLAYIEHEGE